jgi:hypothetical protein
MENFFQRQIQRLAFTTNRMEKRDLEKKDLDALKLAPPVCFVECLINGLCIVNTLEVPQLTL